MTGESLLAQSVVVDPFIGRWHFTKSVYTSEGVQLGILSQHQALELQADSLIRAVEQYELQLEARDHPIAVLQGTWNFNVRREGRTRFYQGRDVYGVGTHWGSSAILGHTIWPRLGCSATSLALLTTPMRQITGERFSIGSHPIAQIVGVGVSEQADGNGQAAPIGGTTAPYEIARLWEGSVQVFDAEGTITREIPRFERAWSRDGWTTIIDGDMAEEMLFVPRRSGGFEAHSETHKGKWVGVGRWFDHTLEIDGVFERSPDTSTDYFGVLDPAGRQFVGIRRVYQRNTLHTVAIEQFRPL